MSDKFSIEIISPDKSIIKTETQEVSIPSYEGEMGILKDHIPIITFLRPGLIKISGVQKIFFVEEGTVEFTDNNLLILTSTVKELIDIDKKFVDTMIKEAQRKINSAEVTDKEKYLLSYKIDTLININK